MTPTKVDISAAAASYERLGRSTQHIVLARWLHELSVAARDTYEPGSRRVAAPARLREFNELAHRVASQLLASLSNQERYPDVVIAELVLLEAQHLKCEDRISAALEDAADRPEGT